MKYCKKIGLFIVLIVLCLFQNYGYASNVAKNKGFNITNFEERFQAEADIKGSTTGGELSGWYGAYTYYDSNDDYLYILAVSWIYVTPSNGYSIKFLNQRINLDLNHSNADLLESANQDLSLINYGPTVENDSYTESSSIEFGVDKDGLSILLSGSTTYNKKFRTLISKVSNNYKKLDLRYVYDSNLNSTISYSTNILLGYYCLGLSNASKYYDLEFNYTFEFQTSFGVGNYLSETGKNNFIINSTGTRNLPSKGFDGSKPIIYC